MPEPLGMEAWASMGTSELDAASDETWLIGLQYAEKRSSGNRHPSGEK